MSRPTKIVIDLSALRHNMRVAQTCAPASRTVAVVKADAYGHGAAVVAKALADSADMFAVSCLEEAMELRLQGITSPVLLLEGCFSADELALCSEHQLAIVVHTEQQVDMLRDNHPLRPLAVWLKVDTGMHRLGVMPDEALSLYRSLKALDSVGELVLATHLASADDTDREHTRMQLQRFSGVKQQINAEYGEVTCSIANSAALLAWPDTHAHWNRPGIMLYGLSPFGYQQQAAQSLRPVMSFESNVIAVRHIDTGEAVGYGNTWRAERPSVIATIAAGYGDGYPRNAKSGTPVLVNGQRAALAGRVSMDMISVDVTDLDDVKVNDPVELWGQSLPANEVASWAQTIGYELVTRMPKRTPRMLINDV